jgi:hypothetical protein
MKPGGRGPRAPARFPPTLSYELIEEIDEFLFRARSNVSQETDRAYELLRAVLNEARRSAIYGEPR